MKCRILTFLSLVLLCLTVRNSSANPVIVTGRVNRPETMVRLMAYDELLTMHQKQLAVSYSDQNGFFILEANIKAITPATIAVGLDEVDVYLSPDASYDVEIIVPEEDNSISYFDRPSPRLRVRTASDKGVYRQIVESEQIIDGYVLTYFNELYRRRQYRFLDSIRNTLQTEIYPAVDPYVSHHNDYKIAAVQMAINADGGKRVISEYFDGKPVLYSCISYVDLFKDLFANKFWQQPYDVASLEDAFWTSSKAFKDYLNTDPFMKRNPRLAEMIIVYNLKAMYYEQPKLHKMVKAHLKALGDSSSFPETKVMVNNVLQDFDRFSTGADAPAFELNDDQGNMVKLDDYQNDHVLLQFVDGSPNLIDQQLSNLSYLHQQLQDTIKIITIVTKDNIQSYRNYFNEKNYDWTLLNLGNDVRLLENYGVKLFPEYVILLPNKKIGMAPAPAPAPNQRLEEQVRRLYAK